MSAYILYRRNKIVFVTDDAQKAVDMFTEKPGLDMEKVTSLEELVASFSKRKPNTDDLLDTLLDLEEFDINEVVGKIKAEGQKGLDQAREVGKKTAESVSKFLSNLGVKITEVADTLTKETPPKK